jgi:hypothetical protein
MQIFQKKTKSRKAQRAMLKEGLLPEGGELDAAALEQFNAINSSGVLKRSTTKSRASDETTIDGLPELKDFTSLFTNLTNRSYIDTEFDVVQVVITLDSKHAVAIVSEDDSHFEVRAYSLDTY